MIMNKKQLLLTFLLIIGMLSRSNGVLAQVQVQMTPECYAEIESGRYIIHFTLPHYWLENEDGNDYENGNGIEAGEDDDCGIFSEIVMNDDVDYDVTDEPGYPELPFFSLNLLLPECASSVNVYMESSVTDMDYPPYYISPATKGSIVNENGAYTELDEECYNSEYYTYGHTSDYPNGFYQNFYSVSGVYTAFNSQGVTFSIYPFSYYPEQGYMEVLQEAVFVVEFDCGDLITTINNANTTLDIQNVASLLYFDTYNDTEIVHNTGVNGTYLIVAAHRDMEESLAPYVLYKQSQNYNTEVIYLDEEGALGNPQQIKDLIYQNNVLPNPDYVLLVGDLNDIPPCHGANDADYPYSDDCYHLLLGRWIIGESWDYYGQYADLRRIVDKTILTETGYTNAYSTASLFSGTDTKKRVSKKFYKSIKKVAKTSFYWMGVPYTLYDGRNYASSQQAQFYMENAVQSHTRFFIYRGHGYDGNGFSGIANPYQIYATMINSFNNDTPEPMGFGFACSLNTYTNDYNFGSRWVAKEQGGVTFYAATTVSYRSANNCLAKKMFNRLRKTTNRIHNFPISLWLRLGEMNYYFAFPVSNRLKQINKYSLIGDPTLSVYGMDYSGSYAPFHAPYKGSIETEVTDDNIFVKEIEIYDINGKKITTANNSMVIESLPLLSGVYIVKTIFSDNTFETNKIIK